MIGPTYHLWLKPSGAPYDLLSSTIAELGRELGTPVFEPHVTLAGPLHGSEQDHLRNSERLASQLSTFEIVLREPSHGPEHFRCVFMLVEPLPTIMRANALAKSTFDLPDDLFTPHLSLVYATFPEAERRRVVSTLSDNLRLTFAAQSVDLIRATSDDPRDWQTVTSVALRRAQA
jgi:hypothetical protein